MMHSSVEKQLQSQVTALLCTGSQAAGVLVREHGLWLEIADRPGSKDGGQAGITSQGM